MRLAHVNPYNKKHKQLLVDVAEYTESVGFWEYDAPIYDDNGECDECGECAKCALAKQSQKRQLSLLGHQFDPASVWERKLPDRFVSHETIRRGLFYDVKASLFVELYPLLQTTAMKRLFDVDTLYIFNANDREFGIWSHDFAPRITSIRFPLKPEWDEMKPKMKKLCGEFYPDIKPIDPTRKNNGSNDPFVTISTEGAAPWKDQIDEWIEKHEAQVVVSESATLTTQEVQSTYTTNDFRNGCASTQKNPFPVDP